MRIGRIKKLKVRKHMEDKFEGNVMTDDILAMIYRTFKRYMKRKRVRD
jgi:hypothetical protein